MRIDADSGLSLTPPAVPDARAAGLRGWRIVLLVATASALAAAVLSGTPAEGGTDPDLVRVIRFMALIKGTFALVAFAVCFWRLARPTPGWRAPAYALTPAAMAGGALALWHLSAFGPAAFGLHLGLLVLLAAALTDRGFLPSPRAPAGRPG
ncbi:hypothetical protein [Methylobacterium nigriterrae]|uniref:hypothetical protein n=1 Tax=Methylobacterium nigriterrae TaxID=3127512 RepID=UPI003013D174